jgi:hypothetical protein
MRRSAPPVSISLRLEPVWRRLCLMVPAMAGLVCAAWWLDHALNTSLTLGSLTTLSLVTLAALALTSGCAGWLLSAVSPTTQPRQDDAELILSWNGECWQMAKTGAAPGITPIALDLHIRIDLGHWLLLSCQQIGDGSGITTRSWPGWIALAQRHHCTDWHLLRCALYSSRSPLPPLHDR